MFDMHAIPADPKPRSEEPTWVCKRCGHHIPILSNVFGAAIAEFHRQEHVITDQRADIDALKERNTRLEKENAVLAAQALGLVSQMIKPDTH